MTTALLDYIDGLTRAQLLGQGSAVKAPTMLFGAIDRIEVARDLAEQASSQGVAIFMGAECLTR